MCLFVGDALSIAHSTDNGRVDGRRVYGWIISELRIARGATDMKVETEKEVPKVREDKAR